MPRSKNYYDSLGPTLPGEPTVVVKVTRDGESRILRTYTWAGHPSGA
jgi:hypothetical protein